MLLLLEAIERNAVEGEPWVRLYGRNRAPYLPYFYLGASLFELGEYAAAIAALDESERQGAVLDAEEAVPFRSYRGRLRSEILPAVREEAQFELDAARRLLAGIDHTIASGQPEDTGATERERAREQLANASAALTRPEVQDDLASLQAARETLAKIDLELTSILELAERGRVELAVAERDVRLRELLATPHPRCDRDHLDALARLLAQELPLAPELDAEAHLAMARGKLECEAFGEARRELDAMTLRLAPPELPADRATNLLARVGPLSEEIARRELESSWRAWFERAQASACDREALERLERSAEALLARFPQRLDRSTISPRFELARRLFACGDLDGAALRLEAAAATQERNEVARAALAGEIRSALAARAQQARLTEAARRLHDALQRLASAQECSPADRTKATGLRQELVTSGLAGAEDLARLDLALARAALGCGELEEATRHLVGLSRQPAVAPAESAEVARQIAERRAAEARALAEREAAGRYVAALGLVSGGACSLEAIALLEDLARDGWTGRADDLPQRVLVALATARLTCGELDRAAETLSSSELALSALEEEIAQIQARLQARRLEAQSAARRERFEASLRELLVGVAGEACHPEGVRALQRTLAEAPAELDPIDVATAAAQAELARAQLACGDLDAAEASLVAARAHHTGRAGPLAELGARVARERERRLEREHRARLLERYVDATTSVDLGLCERAAVETLEEVADLPPDDPLPDWIAEASGLERRPELDLARAQASCGDVAATRRALARLEVQGASAPAEARREVERRLVDRAAHRLYSGRYALLVGASDYARNRGGWWNLAGVSDDLETIRCALVGSGFDAIRTVAPPVTASRIRAAVESFIAEFGGERDGEEHLLLFYFAGHGETLTGRLARDDGSYEFKSGYFVPEDAPRPDGTEAIRDRFLELAVGMDEVDRWARSIRAKHAFFLFDTCFSGTVFRALARGRGLLRVEGTEGSDSILPPLVLARAAKPVRLFATAGAEDQVVPDESVFRRLLVAALEGRRNDADFTRDGFLMGREICLFLEDQVAIETDSRQTPQCGTMPPPFHEGDVIFELRGLERGVEEAMRDRLRKEVEVWRGARTKPIGLDLYLERYPVGRYAGLARFLADDDAAIAASR